MRKIIVLFALTVMTGFAQGQNWIDTSLSNRVSVKFPSTPEIQEFDNLTLFHIGNSEYIINASSADARVSSTFTNSPDSLKNLYLRIIQGKVKAAWNGRIVTERSINLNEYKGLEVEYTRLFEGVNDVRVTTRIFLIDENLVTFDILDLKKIGLDSLKMQFFNSIRVK